MTPSVAIIGGGPAGLMAAEMLAQAGRAVTIYDRMPSLGRKFQLAGRGGLNLTHTEPLPRFLARYGPATLVQDAVADWPPDALRAWCAGLDEAPFVGSSGRVFPLSFKATPLLRAWLRRLAAAGVQVRTNHRWTGWTDEGALRFTTRTGDLEVQPSATILALGGASWPRLGSDGSWVPLLEAAGIAVAPLRPANVGLLHPWSAHFADRFAGHPLKRIAATFEGTTIRGEALITKGGLEGGLIYALSAPIRDAVATHGTATLTLDLRPDLDPAALAARLGGHGQSLSNALRRAGLDPAAAALVREIAAPGQLPDRVKALKLQITGTSPIDRAISTAGGLTLSNLDSTFMLTGHPNLYAIGEMLDWEAPTGGYLLQAAFSTAVTAANAILSGVTEGGHRAPIVIAGPDPATQAVAAGIAPHDETPAG